MVNKTQFYKTKVALAVVLSLGLAACGDSDGDEGSTSNTVSQTDSTQNTVGNQNELTGTVQGVVVDSNANPIAGVMVYLGAQETVTNAGGQYVFTNVAVTNVDGLNNEGDETPDSIAQSLVITIGGTADYLGALVTVTPEAQVNNTGGQGDNGGDDNGSNSTTTIQTFVDGFTAEAGVAVLPMLNAGAYGYIRDCRTGAPLADTADILSLDFVTLTQDGATTPVAGAGAQLTTAEDTHTIGTDASGKFSLDNLASNSSYSISAKEGWSIVSAPADFATASEGSSEFLNTIEVCPTSFTPGANAAPYIRSISNSIDPVSDDGFMWSVLKPGIDGTAGKEIVINFNEAMDVSEIDLDKVVITKQLSFTNVSAGELLVDFAVDAAGDKIISMSDDGKSMTIQLAEALPEMTKFSVWMPRWQYMDTYFAGAAEIVTGDNGTGESDPDATANDIVRDDIVATASGSLDFAGADADLSMLAQAAGTNGNSTTVTLVEAGANTVLSVVVTGTTVTVNLATNGASDSISTAADVVAAVAGSIAANNLVAITASGDGTGIVEGGSDTLTGGGGVINGPIGSGEMGITSDTLNTTQFKTTYVRTRICTFVEVETTVDGVTGEQLIQTLPAEELPETAATWDNGVNGTGAVSNLNGQENAIAGIDTGMRIGTRWGITYDNDQARIVGDLGTLSGVADINVTHFRGSSVQSAANITKVNVGDGTYRVDVDNAAHLDVVRLQPTAAFGIVGDNIDVDLLDLIAPTTTLQENYGLYAETAYDRDTADSGLVAAGEGGEVSVPGAAAALGDPIVYIQPRHLSPVGSDNLADRGDEFEALAGARTTAGNTLIDGDDTANPLYSAAKYTAWTDRSNPLGFGFSENIYVATGAAIGATANTDLTDASYINSLTRNIDGELTAATNLSADIATVDVADMVDLANDDHGYVVQFEGLVADKLSSASTGDNTATEDDSARILLQDAMPPFVTSSRWTGTTVEFTFNEAVVPDGTAPGQTVLCFTDPTTGDVDGDCIDAGEYAVTLDASLRTDGDANNDEDEFAYVLSTDGMSLTVYVDGSKVQALMAGSALVAPQFFFNDDADATLEQHVAVSWDNLEDANGNVWDTFDQDSNTVAEAASARYLVDAPRFLAYDDVGPFEVTNARFIMLDDDGVAPFTDTDGNVTFTITFSHPLDLRDVSTDMGGRLDGAPGNWNGVDRSWTSDVPAELVLINEMFQIDLDGGVASFADLDVAGAAAATVNISSDYRTITLVLSEAGDAVVANTTVIQFTELLDSSIIDGAQWATLDYVVTNTQ